MGGIVLEEKMCKPNINTKGDFIWNVVLVVLPFVGVLAKEYKGYLEIYSCLELLPTILFTIFVILLEIRLSICLYRYKSNSVIAMLIKFICISCCIGVSIYATIWLVYMIGISFSL